MHLKRRWAEIDHGAVNIKQQRDRCDIELGKNVSGCIVRNGLRRHNHYQRLNLRVGSVAHSRRYFARTSTSPSTPVATLNSRSYTLPSLRAMARYSPSARITRGKAPIDSLTTSPPGVRTDQAVLASASPPFSATSLSVIAAARWVTVMSVSLPAATRMSERTTELASP